MAKAFLNEHNVPFEDIDVTKDMEAAKEMIEKSGQMGVPVIIIEEKVEGKGRSVKKADVKEIVIVGFDVTKLKKALKIED